jgi:hypothetical protein
MNECLDDWTLFLLTEGEGSAAQRLHVASCATCSRQQRRLLRASEVAGRILREGPWPERTKRRPRTVVTWLLPLAAAAVLVMAVNMRGHAPRLVGSEAVPLSMTDVSNALFAVDTQGEDPAPDSQYAYLEAAMDGDWPCEGQETALDPRCE